MFNLAIVKLTAFCNLNCAYCYMFNQHDLTYLRVPKRMPVETATTTVDRIADYCFQTGQSHFTISLHGGEPTLWPYASFVQLFNRIGHYRQQGLRFTLLLQTNGLSITPELAQLLAENDVGLGISIDGPKRLNDRYRLSHDGHGSYDRIMKNVDLLVNGGYERIIGGFLCVIQPEIEPADFLEWADGLPIRRLDVLWPLEFNHDNHPWAGQELAVYADHPRYGQWLAELFDLWMQKDDPSLVIRSFYHLIEVFLGSGFHSDSLVNRTIPIFVVNTDGALEYHDYLRSYVDGGTISGLSILGDQLTMFEKDPLVARLMNLGEFTPPECGECEVLGVCGGGHLAGRVKVGDVLPHRRSVLCLDQHYFYGHVKNYLFGSPVSPVPPQLQMLA